MVSARHARVWALKVAGDIRRGDTGLGAHLPPITYNPSTGLYEATIPSMLPYTSPEQRALTAKRIEQGRCTVPWGWRPKNGN